jgi:hypothetical protein
METSNLNFYNPFTISWKCNGHNFKQDFYSRQDALDAVEELHTADDVSGIEAIFQGSNEDKILTVPGLVSIDDGTPWGASYEEIRNRNRTMKLTRVLDLFEGMRRFQM